MLEPFSAVAQVWDYKGDNYVHRLIQNKVDGKLVELPDPRQTGASSGAAGGGGQMAHSQMSAEQEELKQRGLEEQYEAVVHEYSLLLTGQLEVQRRHYEDCLQELEHAHKRQMREAEAELGAREDELRHRYEFISS